jgi:hypothetical protein
VASDKNNIILPSSPKSIIYDAKIRGDEKYKYIYGVDPASEQDNFSIVIIELHPDHNRIVYTWTTNRSNFKDRQKTGLTDEYDFYGFCARKIRNLMKYFPCEKIGMDAQGGGIAIEEAFLNKKTFATLFEINGLGLYLDIPRNHWISALEQCIKFKLEEEKFEDCIKLRDLIEEIKKPIKKISKKKDNGTVVERDTDSN